MPTSSTPAVRVPQHERTRAMRLRLLEATVECLVEHGFAGTSTTLVSERAGVSRGAQLHHFPTKNDLVVAAVAHLTEIRGAELRAAVEALPRGKRRTRAVLAVLGDHFSSPVFAAALELWVAARTDETLYAAVAPLELRVGRETHRLTVDALGADEARSGVRELVQATLDLVRGLGLANTISDDARRRRRILDHWADVLDRELDPPHDVPVLPRSAPPSDNAAGTPNPPHDVPVLPVSAPPSDNAAGTPNPPHDVPVLPRSAPPSDNAAGTPT